MVIIALTKITKGKAEIQLFFDMDNLVKALKLRLFENKSKLRTILDWHVQECFLEQS